MIFTVFLLPSFLQTCMHKSAVEQRGVFLDFYAKEPAILHKQQELGNLDDLPSQLIREQGSLLRDKENFVGACLAD